MEIPFNESKSICSGCGSCCKRYAGIVDPSQFDEITVEGIIAFIDSGYCFDTWAGNPTDDHENDHLERVFYIRPRHKITPTVILTSPGVGSVFFIPKRGAQSRLKIARQCVKPLFLQRIYVASL